MLCCNDWGDGNGKGQTEVGDFTKENTLNNIEEVKRIEIVHNLINGRRYNIDACSGCEVKNSDEENRANLAKKKDLTMELFRKTLMSETDPISW